MHGSKSYWLPEFQIIHREHWRQCYVWYKYNTSLTQVFVCDSWARSLSNITAKIEHNVHNSWLSEIRRALPKRKLTISTSADQQTSVAILLVRHRAPIYCVKVRSRFLGSFKPRGSVNSHHAHESWYQDDKKHYSLWHSRQVWEYNASIQGTLICNNQSTRKPTFRIELVTSNETDYK